MGDEPMELPAGPSTPHLAADSAVMLTGVLIALAASGELTAILAISFTVTRRLRVQLSLVSAIIGFVNQSLGCDDPVEWLGIIVADIYQYMAAEMISSRQNGTRGVVTT